MGSWNRIRNIKQNRELLEVKLWNYLVQNDLTEVSFNEADGEIFAHARYKQTLQVPGAGFPDI